MADATSNGTVHLLPQHLDDLHKSGLNDETIAENGFVSVKDAALVAKHLNWKPGGEKHLKGMAPFLSIPFLDRNGNQFAFDGRQGIMTSFVRFKPDNPRLDDSKKPPRPRKYEGPKSTPVRVYFPRAFWRLLQDPALPFVITEGEKKAAKGCQEGFLTIGLTGVNAWSVKREKDVNGRGKGPRLLLPDLTPLPWRDREVFIVFDSDAATNRMVKGEERRLAGVLQKAGAKVKIVRIPPGKDDAKAGLDDFLTCHGADAFRALMEGATPAAETHGRPIVILGEDESRVIEQTAEAVAGDPCLYQRDGLIVRPQQYRLPARPSPDTKKRSGWVKPEGHTFLRPADPAFVRTRITANVALFGCKGPKKELAPAHPPTWLTPGVMASPGLIRQVEGVLPAPTIDEDGRLIDAPGFDEATGLFLARTVEGISVPRRPDRSDAREATAFLLALVADFPFASEADKARWFCLLLAACGRHLMITSPLGLLTANNAGSGKSYLAKLVSIVAHGNPTPVWRSWPSGGHNGDRDNEVRKSLVTLAAEGIALAVLDNLPRGEALSNCVLDNFLTTEAYYDRELGHNRNIGGPNRTLLLATGNNVAPSGDTADRTLVVRLQSSHPNPRSRPASDFRLPHILDHALDCQADYLSAALTIWKAWIRADRPLGDGPNWGSFEGFVSTAVAMVRWVGLPDPIGDRVKMVREEDVEGRALDVLLGRWRSLFGASAMLAGEILCRLGDPPVEAAKRPAVEPDVVSMREALATLGQFTWPPKDATKIGRTLKARVSQVGQIDGDPFRLKREEDRHTGSWRYSVEVCGGCGGSGGSSLSLRAGERVSHGVLDSSAYASDHDEPLPTSAPPQTDPAEAEEGEVIEL